MRKIIFLLATCCVANVQAQVTNNTELFIGDGVIVSFGMNVKNNTSGKIINNGNMHLQRNLENNGTLESAGMAIIDGSQPQIISSQKELSLAALQIENDLRLETPIHITKQVDFRRGVIESSGINPLIFDALATHRGASDFSHINGVVKKVGADAFEFPLGDGTNYRAFSLETPTETTIFTAAYISKNPSNVSTAMADDVAEISQNEYWTLKADNDKAATKVTLNNTSTLSDVAYLKRNMWQKAADAQFSTKTDLKNGVLFTMSKTREVLASLAAYPNPTEGEFFLKLYGMPENENVKLDVVNHLGQIIIHKEGTVSELRKVYTLPESMVASQLSIRLTREDETSKLTQKLVLNK